jgi:putative hydrolase of the HAD superfamily
MATEFLYFDLGNVLLSFSHERMCRQMSEVAGLEADAVRRALFEGEPASSLQWRFERGDFDAAAAYEHFCQHTGVRPDRAALCAAGSNMFAELPETVALVRRLAAAGCRMGILSNTNPNDWEFVYQRFAFLRECFAHAALSYEARAMKPSAAIYEYAVRRAGVAPEEAFFTDDREENVAGALVAGLDAVVFTSAGQIAEELRRRGIQGA